MSKTTPVNLTDDPANDTMRSRIFKLLAKNPDGLPFAEIKKRLALNRRPSYFKDECVSLKPRMCRAVREGVRGVVFKLTAQGRADLKAGKVESNAPPEAFGITWQDGR